MHTTSGGSVAWQSTSDGANSYSHWAAQQLWSLVARAQRPERMRRIGVLMGLLKAIRRDGLALSRSARRCKTSVGPRAAMSRRIITGLRATLTARMRWQETW